MGCNCGGSTRKIAQPAERDWATKQPPRERRQGGPGQPGYVWSGPKRDPKPDAA
jgi:hypothetical protein